MDEICIKQKLREIRKKILAKRSKENKICKQDKTNSCYFINYGLFNNGMIT